MTAIFNGIAKAAESLFSILPPIGYLTNWMFGILITVGTIYWLWYDAKVRRGGDNYMAKKG
ncbi:MAG: hypothetical protein JNL88_04230 [Bacteroidia bacterium]|nr:hypothetical protein [Bacteroidia bacterium]